MNKICLINPPTTGSSSKEIYFPMGPVCLASELKEYGIPVEIVDFDLDLKKTPNLSYWDQFKDHAIMRLSKTNTRIFGISSICSNYPISLLLAQEIKRVWPESRIILGGPQPSAVPHETLKACPWIDMIVVGEGEITLVELAKCNWTNDALLAIPGIALIVNGTIKTTAPRSLIEDLDSLPFPDFSLLPVEEYLAISPGTALIEAGRGCPFLCSFCSTALMWERNFRVKSPRRIHQEMQSLAKTYHLRTFGLTHDNFTTSHRYVSEFCDYFEKNNSEGFKWSSSARPDTLNVERVESLAKAGCGGVFFGVDSGSPRIQKEIKKNLSITHYEAILHEALSHKMEVTASFILGFSQEREEDLNKTTLLALESKLAGAYAVQLHRLSPLASTEILNANKDSLSLDSGPTDICLLPVNDKVLLDFIARNPVLFSSFYSVPTPLLEDVNIAAFTVFSGILINQAALVFKKILDLTKCKPTQLFQRWLDWKQEYHSSKSVEESFILNSLGQFIEELASTATAIREINRNSADVSSIGFVN